MSATVLRPFVFPLVAASAFFCLAATSQAEMLHAAVDYSLVSDDSPAADILLSASVPRDSVSRICLRAVEIDYGREPGDAGVAAEPWLRTESLVYRVSRSSIDRFQHAEIHDNVIGAPGRLSVGQAGIVASAETFDSLIADESDEQVAFRSGWTL